MTLKESEWKLFRSLHAVALDRWCQRCLSEIAHIASDTGKTAHDRYGEIYKLVRRRDKELAHAFDDMRRSTALGQLCIIHSYGLLVEDEIMRFSPETRKALTLFTRHRI